MPVVFGSWLVYPAVAAAAIAKMTMTPFIIQDHGLALRHGAPAEQEKKQTSIPVFGGEVYLFFCGTF